jgi:hypothetical protein
MSDRNPPPCPPPEAGGGKENSLPPLRGEGRVGGAIYLPTRQLDPKLVALLRSLQPGQKIQITQTIRVGAKKWDAVVVGTFREINYLATGITTERVPEDDIVMPMVHFTKENGELSSVALDENSEVKLIS